MSLECAWAACMSLVSSWSGRSPCAFRAALTAWSTLTPVVARWAAKDAGTTAKTTKTAANAARMVLIPRSTGGECRKPFGWPASPIWGIRALGCLGARCERFGQLCPRRDLELPVHAREVHLDRLRGDEEGLR